MLAANTDPSNIPGLNGWQADMLVVFVITVITVAVLVALHDGAERSRERHEERRKARERHPVRLLKEVEFYEFGPSLNPLPGTSLSWMGTTSKQCTAIIAGKGRCPNEAESQDGLCTRHLDLLTNTRNDD